MNKQKKLISLLLASAMLGATLVSCGGDVNNGDDTANTDGNTSVYSKGLDANGFFEGVKATDYVTLPEYKGVDITADLLEANEADFQAQLDQILAQYDTYEEITDASVAIKDGDTVNIDYVGSIDGVEFEGGSTGGFGTDVTIGVTNYIDDFLEQLIGHKPGENFDIEVTFPENYGKEELNGKDAIFNITINHIHGNVIKAELNADIAADYGFATPEELIADIKDWLVLNTRLYFSIDILEQAEVSEVPQSVLDYIINLDISNYEYYASMYGMTTEEYIAQYTDYESRDAYIEANMENYTSDAELYLAVQAIAETENLTVTSEQIEEAGYTEYVAEMGEPYIKQYMLFQEIIPEFIALNGNVVESLDTEDSTAAE